MSTDHLGNLAAAAYLIEIPVEEVRGYVIIAVKHDDELAWASNRCCMLHSAVTLAEALQVIVRTQPCSAEQPR